MIASGFGVAGSVTPAGPPGVSPWGAVQPWASGLVCVVGPPATVVTFNNGFYVCTTSHTAGLSFAPSNWLQIVAPITGPLPWSSPVPWVTGSIYVVGPPASCVTINGSTYVCNTAHIAASVFDPTKWTLIAQGTLPVRTPVADVNFSPTSAQLIIAYTALSVTRTVSLFPASALPGGTLLSIIDETGSCSDTTSIVAAANGTDTIAGQATKKMIAPYQDLTLRTNGINLWTLA